MKKYSIIIGTLLLFLLIGTSCEKLEQFPTEEIDFENSSNIILLEGDRVEGEQGGNGVAVDREGGLWVL